VRFGFVDQFEAAHHLVGAGVCEKPHGHTYKVEACARLGRAEGELLRLGLRSVCQDWDRKDLNTLMEYPSAENMAQAAFFKLQKAVPGLLWLRIWEGHGKWAEAHVDDPTLKG